MRDYSNLITSIDFTEVDSGECLTKFTAIDAGKKEGDYTVVLHGFRDESGHIYITNEIIKKWEPKP